MSVLLVSANREHLPYPVAPLGLLYLANALKKNNFNPTILDLCFSPNISSDIKKAIKKHKPKIIGLSIRNVDNLTYPKKISYLSAINRIVKIIRQNTKAPLVLGGSAFSLFPQEILNLTKCEFGIIGEGEKAFISLVQTILEGKKNFKTISNLVYISNNKFKKNPSVYIKQPNYLISRDFVNNLQYSKYGGMANIQTKRGCHFKCCYCTYPMLEGSHYRLRAPDSVAAEMAEAIEKHNIKHFFIVDNVFNAPIDHAEAVCKSIIKKKLKANWSCFVNPGIINKRLLELMKKAGCSNIEFGTDALSDLVLGKMKKAFSVEDVFEADILCKDAGIKSAHYIMLGGPGETIETLDLSLKNIEKLNCNAVIVMIGIRIYPGTSLHKLAIKEKLVCASDNLLNPRFYISPKLDLNTFLKRVTEFACANPKCVVPGLGIKSSKKMYSLLRKYYQQGPLWGFLGE